MTVELEMLNEEIGRLRREVETWRAHCKKVDDLVRKVHTAKGRYHTQLAMCDLYDAVGLPNERPKK